MSLSGEILGKTGWKNDTKEPEATKEMHTTQKLQAETVFQLVIFVLCGYLIALIFLLALPGFNFFWD